MKKGLFSSKVKLLALLSASTFSAKATDIVYIKHANSSPNAWSDRSNVKTITSFDNFSFDQDGEYWIAYGDYTITKELNAKNGIKLIGGFRGDESSLSDRSKSDINNDGIISPWEFTFRTEIKPNTGQTTLFPESKLNNILIDGLSIVNMKHGDKESIINTDHPITLSNSIFRGNIGGNKSIMSVGDAIIVGCMFENNSTNTHTGLITVNDVSIDDCLFDSNNGDNGPVIISSNNTFINTSKFLNNKTTNNKGVIGTSKARISESIFEYNQGHNGPVIIVSQDLSILKSTFDNNTTTSDKGVIAASSGSIENSIFNNNKGNNGPVILFSDSISIKGIKFNNNTTTQDRGVIASNTGTIENSVFISNNGHNGPVICFNNSSHIKHSTFNDNKTLNSHGVISSKSGTMDNCVIKSCVSNNGSILYYSESIEITSSTLENCSVSGNNGLIKSNLTHIDNCTFNANKGNNGPILSIDNDGYIKSSILENNIAQDNQNILSAQYATIEDCIFQYNKTGKTTIYLSNSTLKGSIFDGNTAKNESGAIISDHSTIEYVIVRNNKKNAIQLTNNSILQYSLIHNNFDANGFAGVVVNGDNNKLAHLSVINNLGGGIKINGNKNHLINSAIINNSEIWDDKLYKNLETRNNNDYISYIATNDSYNSITGPTKPQNIQGLITPKIEDCFVKPTSFVGQPNNEEQESEIRKSNWRLKILSPLVETGSSENIEWLLRKDLDGRAISGESNRDIGCYKHTIIKDAITVETKPGEELLITQNLSYDTIQINKTHDGRSGAILNMSEESEVENSMLTIEVSPGAWYFISFPFQVEEIIVDGNSNPTYYEHFRLRKFSSERYASGNTSVWGDLGPSGDVANNYIPRIATELGYIFAVNSNTYNNQELVKVTFVAPRNNNEILKNKDVTIPVVSQSNVKASLRGWNLVTNPFASHYNPEAIGLDAIVWSNENNRYELTKEIKPFESFFVQVDETMDIEFPAIGRISHHYPMFDEVMKLPELELVIQQGEKTNSDCTILRLSDDAQEEYMIGVDLTKMASLSTTSSQLHTLKGNEAMMANSITWDKLKAGVTLKSIIKQEGVSTLSIAENELTEISHLWLIDQAGEHHDLLVEPYRFDAKVGEYNFRIQAEIIPLSDDSIEGERVNISSNSGVVTIDNLPENADINLFDLSGRSINKLSAHGSSSVSIDANNNQIVIVEIKYNGKKQQHKVAVN
ncbi:MAG: hypothetical protein ACRC6R_00045 [Bacteroidales bacterium]